MYEFTFEGYNREQCEAYLKRIGAEYDGNPTMENLEMIISAHQKSVPFENLALIMKWGKVKMDPDSLFEKIVTERRGGFCHELNGALLLLLKGLGYDAVGCMARVGLPFLGTLMNLDHAGVIVRINGRKLYCDVGMSGPKADGGVEFGETGSEPLRRENHGQTFWIEDTYEGWKMLRYEGPENDGAVIIFSPIPVLPIDMAANCYYLVERGNTPFHTTRFVNICRDNNGYVSVTDNHIKISDGEKTVERDFPEDEFNDILKEYFGIIR
ncbi:MAG: arylamine N-acetyltransferase [Parasporobacterium sp.]|nr:arylamine N-acetyltransferase [Parasporobacterium sp.]